MPVQSAPTSAKYRVLIVDDNEDIHDDFRMLLRPPDQGRALDDLVSEILGEEDDDTAAALELPAYEFDSAFQGRAAVEAVQGAVEAGNAFALAFVDIRMPPGWNGVETIRNIWKLDPDIQVIICSAYSDYSWEQIVEELGPSDKLLFLRKPFDPSAVKQMALATTSRWRNDLLVRDRVRQLEHRLANSEQQLAALGQEVGEGSPDASRPAGRDILASFEQLRVALDRLLSTPLNVEQMRLVGRATEVCASLKRVVSPAAES
jgi:CheY-like chemotaxis protein